MKCDPDDKQDGQNTRALLSTKEWHFKLSKSGISFLSPKTHEATCNRRYSAPRVTPEYMEEERDFLKRNSFAWMLY